MNCWYCGELLITVECKHTAIFLCENHKSNVYFHFVENLLIRLYFSDKCNPTYYFVYHFSIHKAFYFSDPTIREFPDYYMFYLGPDKVFDKIKMFNIFE